MRILSLFVLCIALGHFAAAQGLQYTQNHYSQILFNPAQTGAFKGTYRVQAIARDQNRSFFGTSYLSPMLSVDSPFMWGFKKTHWVGGGVTLFRDEAGDAGLGTNGMMANLAYHIGLDKKLKRTITLGARYGFMSRFIGDVYTTENDLLVPTSDPGNSENIDLDDVNTGFSTIALGLLFKTPLGKTSSLELGAAGSNILGGTYDILPDSGNNDVTRRYNAHAMVNMMLSSRLAFAPTAFVSLQGQSQNINIQGNFAYHINAEKQQKGRRAKAAPSGEKKDPILLLPGIGYRYNDASAIQFMMGMEYKKWRVGLAYDFAVSGYSNQTRNTAFELAVQRIFAIEKKPKIKPIIFCPRI
jgi:type IX secretion system PorP/SprF family membrane protein